MESKTNYTVVGLVVLILFAGLLSASLWLSIGFDRKKYDFYTVYMREPVSGLSEDSLVKYNGVKVGIVNKIELNQFDPQQVKLQLKIEEGTPITINTHATLIVQGITGTTYLGLTASSPSLFPLQKTPGEPYPVIPYQPSFFSQLEKNINDISIGFKRIFNKKNARVIKETLKNIENISALFDKNGQHINQTLEALPDIIRDLKTGIHHLSQMADDVATAANQVTVTMRTGKNGIDKLSQQTLPPATILLQRLDNIAANLEKVSTEMRRNPAVIWRGSTPLPPGPGE